MEQFGNTTQPLNESRTRLYVAPLRFDHELLLADAALKGWSDAELARKAGVSRMVVSRLRRGADRRSSFAKLAGALDQPLSRYIVREVAA